MTPEELEDGYTNPDSSKWADKYWTILHPWGHSTDLYADEIRVYTNGTLLFIRKGDVFYAVHAKRWISVCASSQTSGAPMGVDRHIMNKEIKNAR